MRSGANLGGPCGVGWFEVQFQRFLQVGKRFFLGCALASRFGRTR